MWLGWLGLVHVVIREVKESSQDIIVNVVLNVVSQTIDVSPLSKRGELDSLLSTLLTAKSIRLFLSIAMENTHRLLRLVELDWVKLRCGDKSLFRTIVIALGSYFLQFDSRIYTMNT